MSEILAEQPPKLSIQSPTDTTLSRQRPKIKSNGSLSSHSSGSRSGEFFMGIPSSPLQPAMQSDLVPELEKPPAPRVRVADAPWINQKASWYYVTQVNRSDNAGLENAKGLLVSSVESLLPLTRARTFLLCYLTGGHWNRIKAIFVALAASAVILCVANLRLLSPFSFLDTVVYIVGALGALIWRVEVLRLRWAQALEEERMYGIPLRFNFTIESPSIVLVALKSSEKRDSAKNPISGTVSPSSPKMIGTLAAWFHHRTVHMTGIHVRPGSRGRGVGKYLLECLISRAEALRCTKLSLTISEFDETLASWAKNRGFEVSRTVRGKVEVEDYPHRQWKGIVYTKTLQAIGG